MRKKGAVRSSKKSSAKALVQYIVVALYHDYESRQRRDARCLGASDPVGSLADAKKLANDLMNENDCSEFLILRFSKARADSPMIVYVQEYGVGHPASIEWERCDD